MAYKVGGKLYLTAQKAWTALVKINPSLEIGAVKNAFGNWLGKNGVAKAEVQGLSVIGNTNYSRKFVSGSGKFHNESVVWTSPTGTQQTYKVYQRTDIDWNMVRTVGDKRFIGKTNAEAARAGFAPELSDGYSATLHHINQNGKGSLVEASRRYHGFGKEGHDILHRIWGKGMGHPNNPVDRMLFQKDFSAYWKQRIGAVQ